MTAKELRDIIRDWPDDAEIVLYYGDKMLPYITIKEVFIDPAKETD